MNMAAHFKTLCLVTVWLLVGSSSSAHAGTPPHFFRAHSFEVPAVPAGSSIETLLPDGSVLIAGGQNSQGVPQATLETRNPTTGEITPISAHLLVARAAHTATVLPDGTVLILGGVGQDGKVVSSAEIFDPISVSVHLLTQPAPTPRAFHTATLLTDGRVLVAGGILDSGLMAQPVELWDFRGQNSTTLTSKAASLIRRNHTAALLSDGRVLFTGGVDANGNSAAQPQVFDPQTQTVSYIADLASLQEPAGSLTEMRASSPQDGAENVPLNTLVSVRFSRPVQMTSVSSTTVTLQEPDGPVAGKIVAAEGGMLAFITPATALLPSTTYTVQVSGVVDAAGQSTASAEFEFSTLGSTPSQFGDETWSPTSDWQTHRPPSKYESLPDLQGPRGTTALAGQVLKLNGEPLEHVTLEIGNQRAQSDSTGRFLLTDIPSGHQVFIIEGATANSPGKTYGRFEFGDEIKSGVTNKLDFKIWMSLLDMAHEVTIPSPTVKETTVTTPTMPGLSLHLPPGTVITDSNGRPVTKITITPIPIDRPPFPLPFVSIPIYFTIQPGGAYISVNGRGPRGASLFYPNNEHKKPGVPYAFWNYNPDHNGWVVYGNGHVNRTGTTVVPDPGVYIYGFSGAMVGSGTGPLTQNTAGDHSADGEPVYLSSGLFVYRKTDLYLPDVIPISLQRTYRPNDSWSRPFGIGATHPYEMFIGGDGSDFGQTAYVDLILPNGTRIHFTGVGSGSYGTYLNSSAGTPWYGAIVTATPSNPNNYTLPGAIQLVTKDGTIYSFPDAAGLDNPGCQGLLAITDRHGNQLKITRSTNTNCTISQITSPSGRYIQFTYDSSYRVKTATDNTGRVVQYNYDTSGRLQTVIDANNGTWTYGYDTLNRMTTIEDPRLITYLTNSYTSAGMVYQQLLADQVSYYQFNWTTTSNTQNVTFTANSGSGGPPPYDVLTFRACGTCNEGYAPLVSQVSVIDPRGYTRQVSFNQNGYTSSDTRALGQPEQETTQYSYYADNLISSTTDQLNRVTSYNYDVMGNVTSRTQLSGTSNAVTTSVEYDGIFSQPVLITDPLGNTTIIGYDNYGNAISVTDPLGHESTFGYNGMGLITSASDALSNTTQFGYDLANLVSVTDPLQNTTAIFNDQAGRPAQVTDPLGHITKYQYNNLNQLTQVTDPLQGITTLTYDPNGNLQTVLDARQQGTNNKTVYTYDSFDHLQTRTDPLNRQESYVFDQLGNLTKFTDRRGQVATFQYDGINRRKFAGYGTQPGPTYQSTINYSYDGGNRLTQVVDSTSGTITPGFDLLDRLTSETTPQGSVSYQYDNDSRLTSATVSGQSSVCYSYDNASRLTGVGQGTCPTSTNIVAITYDIANRRYTLTLPNSIVLTYGFDHDSRISTLSYQLGTSTAIGSLSYQYDADSRRTGLSGSLAATGFPQAVTSATYDVANELTNWNGTTITPDANGNVLNDGVAAYTWNARNQLITRGSTNFEYDSFGRRILNPAGDNLLYEGWNPAQQLSGSTPVENRVLGGIDEFFNRTDTAGSYTPITDALGSVLGLTNSSGAFTTQYGYDPFGNTTSSGSTSTNVFQYTGRENDNNGLYFYRARYYSPQFGRFTSEDPIGFAGGINLYAYVGDNPMNLVDPLGLTDCVVTIVDTVCTNWRPGLNWIEPKSPPPPPVPDMAHVSLFPPTPPPTAGRKNRSDRSGCGAAVTETVTGGVFILGEIALVPVITEYVATTGWSQGIEGALEAGHAYPALIPLTIPVVLYWNGIMDMTADCE